LLPSLSFFKKQKILVLTHKGCDTDAIAGAFALFLALKKHNSVSIGIPEHISLEAKSLCKNLQIPYSLNPSLSNFSTLILLDFNSFDMLGSLESKVKSFKGKIFLLDHHTKSTDKITSPKNTLIDSHAVAVSELVFEWLKKSKISLSSKMASALATGIVEDSAHFLTAGKKTFSIMQECLEKSKKSYKEILLLSKMPEDIGRRIALLKSAQRLELTRHKNFLIVSSEIGAFEGESATSLVKIGADIAFVGNSEKGELKISGRASDFILEKTKIDLAKNVFQTLEKFFQGSGGGHAAAAGFNGKGEIKPALEKCIELAIELLNKK